MGDVRGQAGRLRQGIVGGVGTRDRVTADRDGLARADVLVGEDAGAVRRIESDRVAGDDADDPTGDRRAQEGIVGLVGGGGAGDAQRQRRDVGRDAGRLDQGVVSGVGARDGITRDGDRLRRTHVLVGEDAGAVGLIEGDRITGDDADRPTGDGRGQEGVVSLIRRGRTGDRKRPLGDIGRDGRRLDDLVIGRIGASQDVTGGGHALSVGGVLVREAGDNARRGDYDRIIDERGDRSTGDRRAGITVVGLVCGRESGDPDRQRGHAQRARDHRGTGEVRACDDERASVDVESVGADAEITASAEEGVGRDDRERHRAIAADDAVVEGVRRAHAGEHHEARAAVEILDALDFRDRDGAIGHGLAGDADQHAVRRDDREVARDVAHRVVLGRETAGHEHAGVSTCGVRTGVGAGDCRAARDVGEGVTGQEAAEDDAVEVGGVRGGDELRIAVHDGLEGSGRDVGGDAGRLDDGVVGGLGSAQGITGNRDGLGRTDITVSEDADGVSGVERDGVSADRRDRTAGQRRSDGAVVDLVRGGNAGDGQGQRSNVSRDARGLDESVVTGVRAGEGVTRDGDVLARPDVLVREDPGPAGADESDRIAGEDADGATRDRRTQQRVVNLIGSRGAGDVQRQRGDIGGHSGRLDQGVVSGVGAGEGVTGDRDGLSRADVLVGEDAGPTRPDERDSIARERADRAARDRRGEQRIVSLVGGRGARDAERQRGDIRGHARGLDQGVVAGVRTRDRVARDGDGLDRAGVLITEQAGAIGRAQGDRIAREDADGAPRDGRGEQRVVSLVRRHGPRDVQRQRGDIGGEAGRLDQGVVTRVDAREGVA